jgi:GNAT superfamily N-acetyltransferase
MLLESGGKSLEYRIRLACGETDAAAVRRLDHQAFPSGNFTREPAEPGELEHGVATGGTLLLEVQGEVAGFIQADRRTDGYLYIAGLAIRPDRQGQGLGRILLGSLVAVEEGKGFPRTLVTVVSATNLGSLKVFFANEFVATCVLDDFFGPERHRLGLQHHPSATASETFSVANSDWGALRTQTARGHVVMGVDVERADRLVLGEVERSGILCGSDWPIPSPRRWDGE